MIMNATSTTNVAHSTATVATRLDVRPVLVVGIGGTGCLAVKHLKERARQISRDQPVRFIRYVVFDTTAQETNGEQLDDGEFVNIGQVDLNAIVRHIHDFQHLNWFPADKVKPMQLGLGAGGVRHVGRLCYFQWRETPRVIELLRSRLEDLMNESLVQQVHHLGACADVRLDQSNGMDIHIIASGAGGTGSGIFLDLAYDLRRLAEQLKVPVQISGHLLLPDSFEGIIPQSLMPQAENNCFSLLSEINHFIETGNWEANYKGGPVVMQKQSPFDLMYLLSRSGLENNLWSRDQLVAIVGATIASLAMTPAGKKIKEATVNVMALVLGGTDRAAHKRCPYGSYGIGVAFAAKDDLLREGSAQLRQSVLRHAMQAVSDPVQEVQTAAKKFLNTIRLTEEELEHAVGHALKPCKLDQVVTPADAETTRQLQHRPVVQEETEQIGNQVQADFEPRFKGLQLQKLSQELERVFGTSVAGDGESAPPLLPLTALPEFAVALRAELERLAQSCERRKRELQTMRDKAEATATDLRQNPSPPPDWQKTYEKCISESDRHEVFDPVLAELRAQFERAVVFLSQDVLPRLQGTVKALQRVADDLSRDSVVLEDLNTPYFRFVSSHDVMAAGKADVEDPALAFRRAVVGLLLEPAGTHGHPAKRIHVLLEKAGLESLYEALANYGSDHRLDLDRLMHDMATRGGASLKEQLKIQLHTLHTKAQPAIRCVERLPRESLVYLARVGTTLANPAAKLLRELDPYVQAEADDPTDLVLLRFVYGVPLWAVLGVADWEKAASAVQTEQRMTHNYLNPAWEHVIEPFCPLPADERQSLWIFTLFCLMGCIARDGDEYHFKVDGHEGFAGTRPADRAAACERLTQCLDQGRPSREQAEEAIREYLRHRPDAERVRLIEEHRDGLRAQLVKVLASTTQSSAPLVATTARILRAEMLALNQYLAETRVRMAESATPAPAGS
jgi:hypothetical protein